MKQVLLVFVLLGSRGGQAQDIVSIIGAGITKVIRAVDLEIQRIQTQTIFLQEAQKELENAMSAVRLDEIRGWVEQQKDLYAGYFQELQIVKTVISDYHQVNEVIKREEEILSAYQRAISLFRQDPHFTAAELSQMELVLGGILAESEKNLGQVTSAVLDLVFQMTDEQRMTMIDAASTAIDGNYRDLQLYTDRSELISLQRARDANDYATLLKLYGL